MQVYFWGTRGSLPASITSKMVEAKIFKAIRAAQAIQPETDEAIRAFIRDRLPFAVRSSYGGNTSCVEISNQEEYIICDAGTGLRDFGSQYMKTKMAGRDDLPDVFHIFISHPHWDHIQGFPFFTPAFLPGNQVNIYGCHADLEKIFANQQNTPCFPVSLQAMKAQIRFHLLEADRTFNVADVTVTATKQNHPGGSYGYCFMKEGRKIVYSTDSEHKEDSKESDYKFIDFFHNADLLIFDAQYSLLDAVDAKENWGHSSNILGIELALRADVRRLCLFHNEHTFDDDELDQFLNDTLKYLRIVDGASPLEVYLAYDGLAIEI